MRGLFEVDVLLYFDFLFGWLGLGWGNVRHHCRRSVCHLSCLNSWLGGVKLTDVQHSLST